jgi:FAD/FMN-containing dehydrogenase
VITPEDPRHADFLWAAKGSGPGFFGVVTGFHLALQPQPAQIVCNTYVFPLEAAAEVAALITTFSPSVPRHVELTLFLCPPPPDLGGAAKTSCVVSATAFCERVDDLAPALAALEGSRLATSSIAKIERQPASYPVLFGGMDRLFPQRHRYLAEATWANTPLEDLVSVALESFRRAPSSRSVLLCLLPPAPTADAPPPEAAFSMSASTFAGTYAIWDDASHDGANTSWHRDLVEKLEAYAVGHYVGESDIASRPERARGCFSPAAWDRLAALRRQYDPRGLLHGFFGT